MALLDTLHLACKDRAMMRLGHRHYESEYPFVNLDLGRVLLSVTRRLPARAMTLWGVCLMLASVGCDRKDGVGTRDDSPKTTRTNQPAPAAASRLQAAIDRLRGVPFEHDPAKRPLVLSEAATNRHDWALRALERGYAASGQADSRWDAQAKTSFAAYEDFIHFGQTNWPQLEQALKASAGCDDPMIRYMQARYRADAGRTSLEAAAIEFLGAQESMARSAYHPLFKFMAGLRAVEASRDADTNSNRGPAIVLTTTALEDLARDTNAPVDEVFETTQLWLRHSHNANWFGFVLSDLERLLKANWGQTERWNRFAGWLEDQRAWQARGGGWANTVTDKGWEGFREHMALAERSLARAWQMNSNCAETARLMMDVELGQGQGLQREEAWLNRAMAADTNYYEAAWAMAWYLQPRWHGSDEDTLEFGRRCAACTNWGGLVPLVLVDTHHSLASYYNKADSPDYWHRIEVWKDVQSAYERFFQVNPQAIGWRHNYARDAYLCGQYGAFLQQVKLFGSNTNFTFFGGQAKFQEMLAKTAAHGTGGP
jgi:hypothetical protein